MSNKDVKKGLKQFDSVKAEAFRRAQKKQLPFVAHTSPTAKAAIIVSFISSSIALAGVAALFTRNVVRRAGNEEKPLWEAAKTEVAGAKGTAEGALDDAKDTVKETKSQVKKA